MSRPPAGATPFARALARLRLTQSQAARVLGMSPHGVRRYCMRPGSAGHRQPSRGAWRLLAAWRLLQYIKRRST